MCLEFDFTYAVPNFITISELPVVLYIYLYENKNRNYLEK